MPHTVSVIHYWSWAVNEYFRDIIGNFSLGFAFPCALYLGANLINGVPEGPYYYDAETFQPEEWEYYENPLARLFYKYVVPSTSVSHQLESYLAPLPSENRFERVARLNPALLNLLPKRFSGKRLLSDVFNVISWVVKMWESDILARKCIFRLQIGGNQYTFHISRKCQIYNPFSFKFSGGTLVRVLIIPNHYLWFKK